MRLFVLGGAGYIGSTFVRFATQLGHEVGVYDNLCLGHARALPPAATFIQADLLDAAKLKSSLEAFSPDVVLHYAAFAQVGESVTHPNRYYENNVVGMHVLLDAIRSLPTRPGLVFSSSCAVLGTPKSLPVAEDADPCPSSPYGRSKWICEMMMRDYAVAFGLRGFALRYFNAAGAEAAGDHGEDHSPETHLIPNILTSAREGSSLRVFGTDYDTRDGSCVRDYIHVLDLAKSHIAAAEYLLRNKNTDGLMETLHLGAGRGWTNLEVIDVARRVTGLSVETQMAPRRPGDAAALYADPSRAKAVLGFKTEHSNLEHIVRSAWAWHSKFPNGYRGNA